MKKGLFTLAALATIMASCSSDDALVDENVQNNNDTQVAIGFQTFTNKATRAENSGNGTLEGLEKHHTTFGVWGFKDVDATNFVFGSATAGQKVSYASSWSYSPVRFWDKNANTYVFYAAAPYTLSSSAWTFVGGPSTQSACSFNVTNFTLTDATLATTAYSEYMDKQSNSDLMVATDKTMTVAASTLSDPVELDFNHILSRLNITVKKSNNLSSAVVNVTELKVYGMNGTGTFTEATDLSGTGTTLAGGTTKRWAASGSLVYTANNVTVSSDVQYILQSLVIPQIAGYVGGYRTDGKLSTDTSKDIADSNAPYMVITYTITTTDANDSSITNTESFTAKYNLSNVFKTDSGLAFNEGWQNTLNITIDATQITFNPQTYKWDTTGGVENTLD